MISFVRGRLAEVYDNKCIVETSGLGMEVNVPYTVVESLPHVGEEVILYTYFKISEDAMSLYGFLSRRDEEMFEELIGVSGIGPKAALAILSALTPDDVRIAIASGDAKSIAKAPGVGIKTAQRLILELKDKVDISDIIGSGSGADAGSSASGAAGAGSEDSAAHEAVQALIALGYSASEAMKAVRASARDDMDAEAILKAALRQLL